VSLAETLQRQRVTLGWLLGAAFLAFARPTPASIAAGGLLVAAGASVRTWAAGHIRKREALAVTGPYAHTRNPLYFGSFLMGCGALVMGRNVWLAALTLAAAVPVYHLVMRREEQTLGGIFGEAYAAYAREVPRFFPRLRAPRGSGGAFDWSLVRRHREWRSWLGGAAVALLLLARWFWWGTR
jgi:protein-S-isoprenylcysteine O-methyltransferase Ste14